MPEIPILETERLLLRELRDDDFDAYLEIVADPEVMRFVGDGPLTRDQARREVERLDEHWERWGVGHFAVERREDGRLLGRIGLLRQPDFAPAPDDVEVGWILDRSAWGQGLATEGARASLQFAFADRRLERVISIAEPENRPSLRVMEKAGLSYRGAARWRGRDVLWYAVDRADWDGDGG